MAGARWSTQAKRPCRASRPRPPRGSRGDDAAFSDLYRQGAPRVRGFLTRLSGDPALADDLTQDTFLRVHRARGNFAAGAAALPWTKIASSAIRLETVEPSAARLAS